jgi:hypothetical protein
VLLNFLVSVGDILGIEDPSVRELLTIDTFVGFVEIPVTGGLIPVLYDGFFEPNNHSNIPILICD